MQDLNWGAFDHASHAPQLLLRSYNFYVYDILYVVVDYNISVYLYVYTAVDTCTCTVHVHVSYMYMYMCVFCSEERCEEYNILH